MDESQFTHKDGEKTMRASWYCTVESEETEYRLCVDGKVHFFALNVGEAGYEGIARGRHDGDCNGSCRAEARKTDLRAHIVEIDASPFMNQEKRGKKTVMDARFTNLFQSAVPLVGTWFEKTYVKRDRSVLHVCLGTNHVISNLGDPRAMDDGPVTHIISTGPCDGSCQPKDLMIPVRLLEEYADLFQERYPDLYQELARKLA